MSQADVTTPPAAATPTPAPGRRVRRWLERLARLGLAAKGLVYFTVGAMALRAAFGAGGATTDRYGALHTILRQPLGRVMLALVAAGLAGYTLWRFTQALSGGDDADDRGHRAGVWFTRATRLGSGVVYGLLAAAAAQLLLREAGVGVGDLEGQWWEPEAWTAELLGQPLGRLLVGGGGVGVGLYGLWRMRRAWAASFARDLRLRHVHDSVRHWTVRLGRLGEMARAVVFLLIAGFLLAAATRFDTRHGQGLDDALRALEQAPQGPWLLAAVSVGLIAYGLYQFVEAVYRRVRVRMGN